MLKSNGKFTVSLAYIGSVISLGALLIFKLLPTSELANGIQYTGKEALWVLILSPLFALLGAVTLMYAYIKNYKALQKFLPKPAVTGTIIILAAFMIFNFCVYLSYLIAQFDLGFVAPYAGTVYESLETAVVIGTVLQFISSILANIAIVKNNK